MLCDVDAGYGLAFRQILSLQVVCSALAPPINQSTSCDQSQSSSSASGALRHILTCNERLLGGLGILTPKMEIKMFQLSIGTLVPRMPSEEHTKMEFEEWRFNT